MRHNLVWLMAVPAGAANLYYNQCWQQNLHAPTRFIPILTRLCREDFLFVPLGDSGEIDYYDASGNSSRFGRCGSVSQ